MPTAQDIERLLAFDLNTLAYVGADANNFLYLRAQDGAVLPLMFDAREMVGVSAKTYGAKGDGETDDTAAIQAAIDAVHAAGGGAVVFPAGTYTISATLVLYQKVCLYAVAPNLVTIQLADDSNCPMLKSYRFDDFSGGNAFKVGDDPDMTWGWSIRNLTFDGRRANQSGTVDSWSSMGGLFLYGRRCSMENVYINRMKGIALYTELGLPADTYDVPEDSKPGAFRGVHIQECDYEGWVFRGPSDVFLDDILVERVGPAAYDNTSTFASYPESLLYPGDSIDGVVFDEANGASAQPGSFAGTVEIGFMHVANVFLGWAFKTRGSARVKAQHLIGEGSYGSFHFGPSSRTQVLLLDSHVNSRNRDRTLRPHVLIETNSTCKISNIEIKDGANEQQCNKLEIDGAGSTSERVQLGIVSIIGGTNGRGGHGVVIDRPDVHIGSLMVFGLNGPAADTLDSSALYLQAGAERTFIGAGQCTYCDVGIRNAASGDVWAALNFAARVKLGQFAASVAVAGVVLTATPQGSVLRRANIMVRDESSGVVETFSSTFGEVSIDDTLTTEQTGQIAHGMWRTPSKAEVQLTLHKVSGNAPTLQYFYVTSIDATNINVALKYSSAGTGTSVLGIRAN